MASTGGNLLQRTRCFYFYDTATPCNKREPGSGCSAIRGINRINAILGTSEACIATHPSDMCVALAALEAEVHVAGPAGERAIAFADFHRLPGDTPQLDNNLQSNEIVTAIELPAQGFAKNYSYLKIRDRLSYAFALVSVAAALELDGGRIKEAGWRSAASRTNRGASRRPKRRCGDSRPMRQPSRKRPTLLRRQGFLPPPARSIWRCAIVHTLTQAAKLRLKSSPAKSVGRNPHIGAPPLASWTPSDWRGPYAGELMSGLAYGSVVTSTISKHRADRRNPALAVEGVLDVLTRNGRNGGHHKAYWRGAGRSPSARSMTRRLSSTISRSRWCWPRSGRLRSLRLRWCVSNMKRSPTPPTCTRGSTKPS
jgi:hypothetical protein